MNVVVKLWLLALMLLVQSIGWAKAEPEFPLDANLEATGYPSSHWLDMLAVPPTQRVPDSAPSWTSFSWSTFPTSYAGWTAVGLLLFIFTMKFLRARRNKEYQLHLGDRECFSIPPEFIRPRRDTDLRK